VKATCPHLEQIRDVGPGAEACESCLEIGGTWLNLRQCLVCGRTSCCDSSPNKHATAHFGETGHPLMRSLEQGQDWAWCYLCKEAMRQDDEGGWRAVDQFFEAGMWFARGALENGATLPFEQGTSGENGFPLGMWAATYAGRRRNGTLDPEQEEALETLPGWRW
jgi:hypothetical protein